MENNSTLKDLSVLTILNAQKRGALQIPNPTGIDGKERGSLTFGYPWGSYPQGHVPFDTYGVLDIPVPPSGDVLIPFSPLFLVPNSFDGVITEYSLNFSGGGFDQGSGDIVWRILRNGNPIRNYDNITSERGTIAAPRKANNIRIYSGDNIQIVVNHTANLALNGKIVVSLLGYFYPQAR